MWIVQLTFDISITICAIPWCFKPGVHGCKAWNDNWCGNHFYRKKLYELKTFTSWNNIMLSINNKKGFAINYNDHIFVIIVWPDLRKPSVTLRVHNPNSPYYLLLVTHIQMFSLNISCIALFVNTVLTWKFHPIFI